MTTAGDLAAINADVGLGGQDPLRVAVNGSAEVQGLPSDLAPSAGGGGNRGVGGRVSDRIALNDLAMSTAAGGLRIHGAFPDPKRIDGKVALTMGPASVWQPLLPDIGYDTASADIPLSGQPSSARHPARRARRELTSGSARAGKTARANVKAGETTGGDMPSLEAQAELVISDIVQPEKNLQQLFEKPVRLTLDARYEPDAKARDRAPSRWMPARCRSPATPICGSPRS